MSAETSTLTGTKSADMSDLTVADPLAPEPAAANTTFDEWRRFGTFIKRPTLPDRAASLSASSFVAIGRMWALDIVLMSALITIAMIVVGFGLELPKNALSELEWTAATIAMIILVAPVSEEILFRGWLSGKLGHLLGLLVLGSRIVCRRYLWRRGHKCGRDYWRGGDDHRRGAGDRAALEAGQPTTTAVVYGVVSRVLLA